MVMSGFLDPLLPARLVNVGRHTFVNLAVHDEKLYHAVTKRCRAIGRHRVRKSVG
jgi:hypothetical protein